MSALQRLRTRMSSRVAILAMMAGALGALGLTVAPAASAAAGGSGHTVTMTENFHGTTTFQDFNPCTGELLDITGVGNSVNHVTYFPDGDEVWATFTDTFKVTATGTVTGVVYTGHSTDWGNFNLNERNQNTTFTNTIVVRGSDGSTIKLHDVSHVTYNGNGIIRLLGGRRRRLGECGGHLLAVLPRHKLQHLARHVKRVLRERPEPAGQSPAGARSRLHVLPRCRSTSFRSSSSRKNTRSRSACDGTATNRPFAAAMA